MSHVPPLSQDSDKEDELEDSSDRALAEIAKKKEAAAKRVADAKAADASGTPPCCAARHAPRQFIPACLLTPATHSHLRVRSPIW